VKYESLDIEIYNSVTWSLVHSEMTEQERLFVHGLIRYNKPKCLLEIGVSRGGGSVNLLNAISDDCEATLTSIDKLEYYYRDKNVKVGSDVEKVFPKLPQGKWNLLTGTDPCNVIEKIEKKFDFVVIDTSHAHPIESLNFLCVFPFMKDDAIIILHDISLVYNHSPKAPLSLAPRILASSLTGEKIFPSVKSALYVSDTEPVHNICAVVMTQEQRQQIIDVFISLSIPWQTYPLREIVNIRNLIEKYYSYECLEMFDEADRLNLTKMISGGTSWSAASLSINLKKLPSKTIFYGAGEYMHRLLQLYRHSGIKFNFPIWDIKANEIISIDGHTVSVPDFDTVVTDITMVITLGNNIIANNIKAKLKKLGYKCIMGLTELLTLPALSIEQFPSDFTDEEKQLFYYVKQNGLTMVSCERMFATMATCKYVAENNIPGDFVECGVWRGGNAILAAGIFSLLNSDKNVWLYDTFMGFVDADIKSGEFDELESAREERTQELYYNTKHCGNSLEDVMSYFKDYNLLSDNIRFVKGDVLKTLEFNDTPTQIAVLRLDTDLYDSTLKELEIMYPKLVKGGILMIDDYGYHIGAKKAVDNFFASQGIKPFLYPIDNTGRIMVKIED